MCRASRCMRIIWYFTRSTWLVANNSKNTTASAVTHYMPVCIQCYHGASINSSWITCHFFEAYNRFFWMIILPDISSWQLQGLHNARKLLYFQVFPYVTWYKAVVSGPAAPLHFSAMLDSEKDLNTLIEQSVHKVL